MKAEHFLINAKFASATNMPVSFNAIRVRETQKAIWVYGHGAMDPYGHCAACGRILTHPGSILIGIGPECLGNWGARDAKLVNMTEEEKERLKALVTNRVVDGWIPKSIIKKSTEVEEEITLPEDHKSLPSKKAAPSSKSTSSVTSDTNAKIAKEWKDSIAIIFPYSFDTLTKVKTLEGRKYHGDSTPKYWTCPIRVDSILKLREWGFEIDSTLTKYVVENLPTGQEVIEALSESIGTALTKSGIKCELFPFQKDGVAFLHSRKGRALIGDEMGLGKTIQALAYLQLHREHRPAVIVCPASLKLNWAKEIRDTMNPCPGIQILEGRTPYRINKEIIIINYDILQYWVQALLSISPKIIIADECHAFKNNDALRTKAVKLLAKPVPHFIALSGTPIVNRPIEIYNAISIINPSVVPGFWKYAQRYCGAKHNGFGWDFSGASNTDELHKILTDSIMIRRKKADVLKDLPDKLYSFVPMTLSNIQEYDAIERDVIGYLRQAKGEEAADRASNAEIMVQMEMLKQAAVRGKLNAAIEWIGEFLESGEKLVIFAIHKFVIDRLMEKFGTIAVKIDGSTSMTDRNTAVERFQKDDKIRVIFGNMQAMGVGLTLTAASNVGILELPWTPGELKQAEDRCHRIGQKFTVGIHMLLAVGTIEEDIARLLDKKRKVLDAVLDGIETKSESLLSELMNSLIFDKRNIFKKIGKLQAT